MTGISNLNIVIQQGDTARDAQQLKSSHQETQQVAASVQPEKEVKERTSVQQTPDSRKMRWQKEKREERERRLKKKKAEQNKKKDKNNDDKSDHILDTIA